MELIYFDEFLNDRVESICDIRLFCVCQNEKLLSLEENHQVQKWIVVWSKKKSD